MSQLKMLERYESHVGVRHLDVGSALGGFWTTADGRGGSGDDPELASHHRSPRRVLAGDSDLF